MSTDPRAWLQDVRDRSEADKACYRCRLTKREHQAGYAASRCTFTTSPHPDSVKADMAAALLAVLDVCDAWDGRAKSLDTTAATVPDEGIADTLREEAEDWRFHARVIRDTITERLGADRA